MRTTLSKIRKHHPCKEGWEKLLRHLNKTQPDDEPLLLEEILDSNGLDDALWCLRAVEGHDREMRLYAVWCARQVRYLMTDPRRVAALDVTERYVRGQASREELAAAAREAARESVTCVSIAAWEAAWAEARESTWTQSVRVAREVAAAREQAAIDAQVAEFRRVCREIDSGRDPYPMEAKP